MRYKIFYLVAICCFSTLVSNAQWSLTGNSSTTPGTNYLGTSDGQALVIKTNGTERVRVDENGNVGVGTNSPSSYLHINPGGTISQSSSLLKVTANSGLGIIDLFNLDGLGQFIFKDMSGGTILSSSYLQERVNVSKSLWTNGIYNSGGINTSSIGGLNWSGTRIILDNSSITYKPQAGSWLETGASAHRFSVAESITGSNNLASFDNGGSPLMVLSKDGNVGIGTQSPAAPLQISTSTTGFTPSLWLKSDNGYMGTMMYIQSQSVNPNNKLRAFGIDSYGLSFYRMNDDNSGFQNATPDLVIANGGNIGIATTAPSEKFEVTGNVKFSGALMPNNTAGTAGQVLTSAGASNPPTWTTPSSSGSGWSLTGNATTDPAINFIGTTDDKGFSIRTNNSERVSISNTGAVVFKTPLATNVNELIFSINGGTTQSGILTNLFEQTSSGGFDFKTSNGGSVLSFNSNSMLLYSGNGTDVDFTHSGQVTANYFTARRLRGIDWSNTEIRLDAPGIQYKALGASYLGTGEAAHKFTVNTPLTESGANIASFDNGSTSLVTITKEGKVLIGTPDASQTGSNILAVNGSAIFTKATVKLNANWPDFVFEDKYGLLPIAKLEEYIKTNKHLPNVPATAEVKEKGIDLGGNQALLLQKIEELTLYIIEQNKKIESLERDMIKVKHDQPINK